MLIFLKAFAVFAGTIIGVGIFGLPYITAKAGFPVVLLYFSLMTPAVIYIHFLYGKVAWHTEKLHRFPGYVNEYLGTRWKNLAFLTATFGLLGALLAYLIVGGEFLRLYFSPYVGGGSTFWTLIFFGAGSLLVFRGIKSISWIELSLLFLFLVLFLVLFLRAIPSMNLGYFQAIDWRFFTFPYGVIIFSLWGLDLVPELKEMLKGNFKTLRRVIISGIIFSALVYLFFIIMIFGVTGPETSKEAFGEFSRVLGGSLVRLGFIFGVITTFTSFIALALTLQKTFWYDFGLPKNLAFIITCFAPLLLFFLGLREFIDIVGLVGAVSIGLGAIILLFLYRKFLEIKFAKKAPFYIYPLIGVFILGIIFEAIYLFLARAQ